MMPEQRRLTVSRKNHIQPAAVNMIGLGLLIPLSHILRVPAARSHSPANPFKQLILDILPGKRLNTVWKTRGEEERRL